MGVLDFAAMGAPEKARSLVADHPQRHMHKGGADGDALARIETRRRRSVGHGGPPGGQTARRRLPSRPRRRCGRQAEIQEQKRRGARLLLQTAILGKRTTRRLMNPGSNF
ncbi:hypothetical protein ZWY2020_038989 [Hordeum vulgare]|nr:hypothetical protein ZWY2020_038989 [Hordeum vulgare]